MKQSRPVLTAMRVPCSVRTADRTSPLGTGTHAATGRSSASDRQRQNRQRLPLCAGHRFPIQRFKRLRGLPPPTTGGHTQTTHHLQHGTSTAPPTAQVDDPWKRRHATTALLSALGNPTMTGREMRWDRPHIDPLTVARGAPMVNRCRSSGSDLGRSPLGPAFGAMRRSTGDQLPPAALATPRMGAHRVPSAPDDRGVCPVCFKVRSVTGSCRCT